MKTVKTARPVSASRHVVFINIAATGHMNPTLPLAVEFLKRQICVSYFVPDKAGVVDVVKSTGATWYPIEEHQ